MRHHDANKKFGRPRNQRKALMRSLAFSLIEHGKIETTEAKAKALRPYIEKMITRSREDTLSNRRVIEKQFANNQKDAVKKLFADIGPKYKDRAGGYTRITKIFKRSDDARKVAVIELV